MKITRYVNGKRIERPLDSGTVIKNDEMAQAIYMANHRLNGVVNQRVNKIIKEAENE